MQALDLLLGDLDLLERLRDLLEGQIAALAALDDQLAQLLGVGQRTPRRCLRRPPRSSPDSRRPPPEAHPPSLPIARPLLSGRASLPAPRTRAGGYRHGSRAERAPYPCARWPRSRPPVTDAATSRPGARRPRSASPASASAASRRSSTSPPRPTATPRPLLRRARVLRRPRPAPGRRPHVPLRGDRQRGDRRRRSWSRRCAPRSSPRRSPSRCASASTGMRAEVTIAARYPETVPTPVSGTRHAGDLHAVRHRGRLRARHPHADRGRGPGHDRLPLRPGAARRPLARAPRRRRLHRRRRSSASSRPSRSPPTTSAGSARSTSAGPRASRPTIDARDLLHIVESSMSSEIYELMKRSDEAAWSRRPTATPASSRTSSAR